MNKLIIDFIKNNWNYRIASSIKLCQQFAVDERFDIVDHEEHDGLRNQVSASLGHDLHVGVDEVADRLHLALELRINWAQRCILTLN